MQAREIHKVHNFVAPARRACSSSALGRKVQGARLAAAAALAGLPSPAGGAGPGPHGAAGAAAAVTCGCDKRIRTLQNKLRYVRLGGSLQQNMGRATNLAFDSSSQGTASRQRRGLGRRFVRCSSAALCSSAATPCTCWAHDIVTSASLCLACEGGTDPEHGCVAAETREEQVLAPHSGSLARAQGLGLAGCLQ